MRTEAIPMENLAQLLDVQLQHGLAPLQVTGYSMHPTFRDRKDTVMLRAFDGKLKKGDVILYRRDNGRYILHRVISSPKVDVFLCAGDNQYISERVCSRQVLAVVESFSRGKKTVHSGDFLYRLYVWAWIGLFPVRKPLLALRRRLGRLRRKTKK